MSSTHSTQIRLFQPLATESQHVRWSGGAFDTGRRSWTPSVSGELRVSQYLVFATLSGSADRLEVRSACGHRFKGVDRSGTISLVPMGCERRSQAEGVSAKWASLAIDDGLMSRVAADFSGRVHDGCCHTSVEDSYLWGLLAELDRLHTADGALDPTYCEAMSLGAAHYIHARYLQSRSPIVHKQRLRLSSWQVRTIADFVTDRLDQPLRVGDLASLLQLSDGHFHRAFRATCGLSPLQFIHRERIRRAQVLLETTPEATVLELALRVGFSSPSYFARTFRHWVGVKPSQYRRLKLRS